MKEKEQATLTEKIILKDGMEMQKKISSDYAESAGECLNQQLQGTLMGISSEEQNLNMDIVNELYTRGWYQPKTAKDSDVMKTKEKFLNDLH